MQQAGSYARRPPVTQAALSALSGHRHLPCSSRCPSTGHHAIALSTSASTSSTGHPCRLTGQRCCHGRLLCAALPARAPLPPAGAALAPSPSSTLAADASQLRLQAELQALGIQVEARQLQPGSTHRVDCPFCRGGDKKERFTFAILVHDSGRAASLRCWRAAKCGYKGTVGELGLLGRRQPQALPRPEELHEQGDDDVSDYFQKIGVSSATLRACGVRRWFGVVAAEGGDSQEQDPSSYAVLTYAKGEQAAMQLHIDISAANTQLVYGRTLVQREQRYSSGDPEDQPKQPWEVRGIPGARSVLWGYDQALACALKAKQGGEVPGQYVLYIAEDFLDRLALVEAGVPADQVVALPPNARTRFQTWQARTARAASDTRSASRRRHDAERIGAQAFTPAQSSRSVFDYFIDAGELLDACTLVVLVLHATEASAQLGEELARLVGPERCARIPWPTQTEQLFWTSPDSAYHKAYNVWQEARHVAHGEGAGGEGSEAAGAAEAGVGSSEDSPQPQAEGPSPAFFVMALAGVDSYNRMMEQKQAREQLQSQEQQQQQQVVSAQGYADGYQAVAALSSSHVPQEAVDEDLWQLLDIPPLLGQVERFSAHDMLMLDGAVALWWHLQQGLEEWPLQGLYQFSRFRQEVLDYYEQTRSSNMAAPTGWPGLDVFYKVLPGELTIVTGVPNSGKSEWLDALAVNLAETLGWPIAFCSFEKNVKHHAIQLVEKFTRMPVFKATGTQRPDPDTFMNALEFIDDFFFLIRRDSDRFPSDNSSYDTGWDSDGDSLEDVPGGWQPSYERDLPMPAQLPSTDRSGPPPTIDWVIKMATLAVQRYGIRGLVIDPYNELDHTRPSHVTETEYVSTMLSKVKRFAQRYNVHVWLVAHPRQLQNWEGKAPSLYDISGSAHFINKADCGVVVHRNWDGLEDDPDAGRKVNIIIQKCRNKAAGKVGNFELLYDVNTGCYSGLGD